MKLVHTPQRPVNAGTAEAFTAVEAQLGLVLPNDYKSIINLYGDGKWQDFWLLLNPFSPKPHLNLLRQASRDDSSGNNILSAERSMRDQLQHSHSIWPERGGIFPWGLTDNGGRFFWLTEGRPEMWPSIYYRSRDPDYEEIELPTAEIIAGLLTGELPLFDEEFSGETPPATFEPLPILA